MSNARIVLAEDDLDLRLFLVSFLEEAGYQVIPVDNGAAALQLVAVKTSIVLITDVEMPEMDGWTLVQRVHERGLPARILVLSSNSSVDELAETHGIDGWIAKPFDIDELLATVASLARQG